MQNIEKIYEENFELVKKYLFCLTHNNDIAEELTQKTFYIAVKKIDTFKSKCKISVWLCQIAKNLWYTELKKNKKIDHIDEKEIAGLLPLHNIEEIVISNESKINMYKKIQKLDSPMKDVIYLRITGELSFKEIGNILDKTEQWARVTFYRAKQKLKEVDEYEKRV